MSTLKNKKIKDTYEGLLKTSTNLALDGTLTQIQDGTGQDSNVKINNLGDIELNTLKFTALEDSNAVKINNFLVSSELFLSTETKIPTVGSVKKYVDNNISTQDLDFSGDIGTGAVDLDSQIFIVEGKSGITTEASSNALIIDGGTLETNISTNATDITTNTTNISTINTTAEFLVNKGQPSGYVPLDASSKILETYLPASIIGGLKFQGTWNATTDDPSLPLASTVNGHYYIVSVAGTFETIIYGVGDWVISNGIAWSKIDNTESVSTVFGRVGNILANSSDYDTFYPTLANLPLLVSNNTAVAANTLKVGITTAQASEITVNTAKVGYTDAKVAASAAVVANTAKVGITTAQADEIAVNTLKDGITTAQANEIAANTLKVGYTDALVSANVSVVANTAKVGITTAQANAIVTNTTDIATNTNEIATNTIKPQSASQAITFIPIYTDTLEIGNSIMAQSDGTQNAKFINVYGRMTMNGGGGDANGGTLNLTSNSARLGIATNSITGNQPEAALDVGKNARVRGSLNVGLTNEQYLFVSTTGDTPVGYVKMGYYGTGTDYDSSGGAQAATQYTTAFSNGGKICEDERIMTFVLSRATMVSLGALGVAGKELIPQDSNFTYIVKEAYIYSVPTSGGRAPTFNASSDLQIAYQTVNNGTRTTTAYKLGTTEFNASRDSRKLMTFEQSKAVAVGTINAVPKSSVRISLSGGIADTGAGDCDFYLRMRVKNIDFNDDIKNNSQLITIS